MEALSGSDFVSSNLMEASFDSSSMTDAHFVKCDMRKVYGRRLDFRYARFVECKFDGSLFRDCVADFVLDWRKRDTAVDGSVRTSSSGTNGATGGAAYGSVFTGSMLSSPEEENSLSSDQFLSEVLLLCVQDSLGKSLAEAVRGGLRW